jgi:cytosine/adenosine deaminase-related metal-dependent hydrolase
MSNNPKDVDLLIHNGYLITMNQSREIIEGGSVAIANGKIVDMLRKSE